MIRVGYIFGWILGTALRPAFRRYLESWSEARAELAGDDEFRSYADEACALTTEETR